MKIYVDFTLSRKARELLENRTTAHELFFAPESPPGRRKAAPDPEFQSADVAFGHPDIPAIEQNRTLKWIHIRSSGFAQYDNPPFRSMMERRNIQVSNSASVYSRPCAVHLLSCMLAQARDLPRSLQTRTSGRSSPEWIELRNECVLLQGQRVLILGYGSIGEILVELLQPFEMDILAYRRKPRGYEPIPVLTQSELDTTLSEGVDHIVNILPASPQTRHFFNAERFASIRPGAVFYNIGRGSTVDQDALLKSLQSGRLKAAWLDVTDPEPLPETHPLLSQPNCYITPHLAGGHVGEDLSLVRHFLDNLERFENREILLDRIM